MTKRVKKSTPSAKRKTARVARGLRSGNLIVRFGKHTKRVSEQIFKPGDRVGVKVCPESGDVYWSSLRKKKRALNS